MPRRLICAVIPASGAPVLIVPKLEHLFAKRRTWFADVRYHVEWQSVTEAFGGLNLLNEIFKERGLEGKKIGVEKNFISAALHDFFHQPAVRIRNSFECWRRRGNARHQVSRGDRDHVHRRQNGGPGVLR
jgi:Xaa-Pro aminopeptidase